jgi:protein kinase C substrate 80K-H
MAVLAAVRDYEAYAKLPHINDVRSSADEAAAEVKQEETEAKIEEGEEKNDGLWTTDELDSKLNEVLKADYEALLLEHDKHVGTPDSTESLRKCLFRLFRRVSLKIVGIVFDVAAYLPDSLKPQYETIRDTLLSWLGGKKAEADNNEGLRSAIPAPSLKH